MKNSLLILAIIVILTCCSKEKLSRKDVVTTYYKALDSGTYNRIKEVVNDSVTIVSGDYVMPFDKIGFYEFYKWDSIFDPSYEILELSEENDDIIVSIRQKNIRNSFLKNNPLQLKVKVSFASGKISKFKELDYIDVNWDTWNQTKDSLVSFIKTKHPKLDGFVNDMTMNGATNYLKAIELFENQK